MRGAKSFLSSIGRAAVLIFDLSTLEIKTPGGARLFVRARPENQNRPLVLIFDLIGFGNQNSRNALVFPAEQQKIKIRPRNRNSKETKPAQWWKGWIL